MKAALCLEEILAAVPEATAALLVQVAEVAKQRGVGVFLVGGPVRDLLLGRSLDDVDLMLEGDALEVAQALAERSDEAGIRVLSHDRFGTVRVESADARIDLARARAETYAHPGALPETRPGMLAEDMQRRDFSVNALCCPIDADQPGKRQAVLDLEGGLEDLEQRRLRILHPRSFHDDPTRAWRAARFAARLGFNLDRRSRNALRDALRDGAFGAVSGERFRRELQRTFREARHGVHVGHILRTLSDWHVLAALEPGLELGRDRMSPLRRLSKTIADPEWPSPRWRPSIAGLSIWLAPLPAALRRRTLERFSVRGEQAARIVRFGRDADRILRALHQARGRGSVDATLSELPEETVQALYALASVAVRRRMLRWGAEDRRRRAPVGGADLKEVGLSGPEVGRALARIRAGFLDGEIANREEALALAEEMARRLARRAAKDARARKGASGSPRKGRRKVARDSAIADTPSKRRRSAPSPSNDSSDSEDSPQAPRTDVSR